MDGLLIDEEINVQMKRHFHQQLNAEMIRKELTFSLFLQLFPGQMPISPQSILDSDK